MTLVLGRRMAMRVSVRMAMVVSSVCVAKRCQANHIDKTTENADDEEFVQSAELSTFT